MKSNLASIHGTEPAQASIESALVTGVGGDSVMLDTEYGVVKASVAVSCLVAPRSGDRVLASLGKPGNFVLAILEGRRRWLSL